MNHKKIESNKSKVKCLSIDIWKQFQNRVAIRTHEDS